MRYQQLGTTGLHPSQLCFGTWMFGSVLGDDEVVDRDAAHELLDAARDLGINFIDTANVYGSRMATGAPPGAERHFDPGVSESYIGEWLGSVDREDVIIASKAYWATRGRHLASLSRKTVRAEIEGTLERLGTDYLDIYFHHGWHPPSPLEETLSAFNDLVRDGRVHYLGLSNFTSWQLVKAREICRRNGWEIPCVTQPRFNAVDHVPFTVDPEELALLDLVDACRSEGIAITAYAPLAGGFLAGRYERGDDGEVVRPGDSRGGRSDRYGPFPDRWWDVLDEVRSVASEVDATPAQVAIAWLLATPGVSVFPIVGARTITHLETAAAATELELTEQQWERISDAGALELGSKAYLYS